MFNKIIKQFLTNKVKQKETERFIRSINRKVYLIDHDENLDEVIDQQGKQVYEHIDKPLALELYPMIRERTKQIY